MREGFAFLMTSSTGDNEPKLWLKLWFYSRLEYEAVET